jgi:hypothetical protein
MQLKCKVQVPLSHIWRWKWVQVSRSEEGLWSTTGRLTLVKTFSEPPFKCFDFLSYVNNKASEFSFKWREKFYWSAFVLGRVVEWNAHPPSTKEEKKPKVTKCKNSYSKTLPSQGKWQYNMMQVACHSLLNASPPPLVKKIQIKFIFLEDLM